MPELVDSLLAKPSGALLASKATLGATLSGQPVLRTDLIPERE